MQLRDTACLFFLAVSCSAPPPPATSLPERASGAASPAAAPLVASSNVRFHRAITTSVPEAQQHFDRGLLLCYAFNHEAAIAAFKRAAEADPDCAMAWWGHALALGPNINAPSMDEAASKAALEAVTHAKELAAGASPVEQALIEALACRYAAPPPADRKPLDAAYADAMREVWREHPDDPDVGALFSESLLDVRPWDQWTKDGAPQPGTLEAVATIAAVLERHPDHPGANHMQIHTLEGSPNPERALPAADKLRTLVPDAPHLLHMPAHIDMQIGHYAEAVAANQRAIVADQRDRDAGTVAGVQQMYRAHNHRHLAWAAMYDGQKKVALEAAREMVHKMTEGATRRRPQTVEAALALPWSVLVRFGEWEALLAEPAPMDDQIALQAFWHQARALAFSALRRIDEADAERAAFESAAAKVPADYRLGKNAVVDVLEVARPFTEGELEYRHGRFDRAFELLREAVRREEALHYDEPWDWVTPVRHALGALLLEQGRVADADLVYREDLRRHPENGWSLHGLAECLRRSDRAADAALVDARFRVAWARADVVLCGSCFCRVGG